MEVKSDSLGIKELKGKNLCCPFAVSYIMYSLKDDLPVFCLCWFKAENYMRQHNSEKIDTLYAECVHPLFFSDCELYSSIPSLI